MALLYFFASVAISAWLLDVSVKEGVTEFQQVMDVAHLQGVRL